MIRIKSTQILVVGFLISSASLVIAQDGGGKDIKPISPEVLAKAAKSSKAVSIGDAFLKENRIDDAIKSFQEAVSIEDTMPGRTSIGNYALAGALTLAGRTEEALAAYKRAIWWNPSKKDLDVNGPQTVLVAMDYAILLAKTGHAEEAKSLYYFGMRNFNPFSEKAFEPIPFLVVFDPEPNATVWTYTPERLIAAATMAKAPFMGRKAEAMVKEVRAMEPNWALPVVFQASMRLGPSRTELLNTAEGLAKSSQERGQIRAMKAGETVEFEGAKIRKSSMALTRSKEKLSSSYAGAIKKQ